jgi:hypothetical protein
VVGRIEILPPNPVHAASASRTAAADPVAAADALSGRRGGAAPRPAPVDVVIDIDAAGNPQRSSTGTAESGSQHRGRRRALPYTPPEGRRSPYATAAAGTTNKPSLREAGSLAYRSADALVADYAHRGTFFDLTV